MAQTLFAPITKLFKALNQRGLKGTIIQLYTVTELFFNPCGSAQFINLYWGCLIDWRS